MKGTWTTMNRALRMFVVSMVALSLAWPTALREASAAENHGAMPEAREMTQAVAMIDGKVMIIGGKSSSNDLIGLNTTRIYDPTADDWSPGPSMLSTRYAHAAAALPDGSILAIGGANSSTSVLADVEKYDPIAGVWSPAEPLSVPRISHTATTLLDGRVLVAGGNNSTGNLTQTEIYNPSTGTWSAGPDLPHAMMAHSAALLGDGRVMLMGGIDNTNSTPLSATLIFDPVSNSWSSGANLGTPRAYSAAAQLEDGRITINGGFSSVFKVESSTEIFDPETDEWIAGPPMDLTRYFHASVLMQNGKVFVAGGNGTLGLNGTLAASGSFHPKPRTARPLANTAPGEVAAGTPIELSTSTPNATIRYTIDGSTPGTTSPVYSTPITVEESMTIRAIAYRTDWDDSRELSVDYTVNLLPAAVPTATPAGGAVASGTTVTLASATSDADIYYTTDGNAPTTGSTLYTAPIRISGAVTIKAIAVKAGMINSPVMTAAYTIAPRQPSGSQPSTPPAPPAPPSNGADVLVNGKPESAGTVATSKRDGRTVTTVSIDEQKLDQRLANEKDGATITIPVPADTPVAVGQLNGQTVKNMEGKLAVLELRTGSAAYTLPAKQIDIEALSAQLGNPAALRDITVSIEIAEPTEAAVEVVRQASNGNFTLVVPPLEFHVRASYGEKTVEVNRFSAYVERTILIPDGVDPNQITTAVVVEPDGSVRHIPTTIVQIDGIYYARVSSLTNSTYSVVWHPVEFADMADHWAKAAVNDMGSRMIVGGFGDGLFHPDQDMTRAEFAAIIVRALGLKPEQGKAPFRDVIATDWYSAFIQTAATYGLLNGFADGTFRPEDNITREQAMTIIAKAMKISGLKNKLAAGDPADLLNSYADAQRIAAWAAGSVADNVQAGIVTGKNGNRLDPKSYVTRAEAAVMVRNLLIKSGLI